MTDRYHRQPVVAFAILLAVLLTACSSASTASGPAPTTERSRADTTAPVDGAEAAGSPAVDVAQLVTDFVGDGPGGADLLVIHNGETTRVAAGEASSAGDTLMPGRPFRVGSISKVFVAAMVLQLVEDGLVDLDEPLATFLAETPIGGDVMIRELLSHTSGIPNYTEQLLFFPTLLADRSKHLTPAEVIETVIGTPGGERGTFSYSNTNYILLGQLIEALDGVDLAQSLEHRVTGPAQLENTLFGHVDEALPDDLVGGWSPGVIDGDPAEPYESIASSAWAAGALVSTTDDLAAFATALGDGTLLSDESFAAMTTTGTTGNGLGLFATPLDDSGAGFGHGGAIPGYQSQLVFDPSSGTIIVALANTDGLQPGLLATEVAAAIAD